MITDDRSDVVTEKCNIRSKGLHRLSISSIIDLFLEEEKKSIENLFKIKKELLGFLESAKARFFKGGRLIYVGAGSSGRLGVLDASELPPTFSLEEGRVIALIAGGDRAIQTAVEGAEDDFLSSATELEDLKVNQSDIILGISAGGSTPYVLGAIAHGKKKGALTALISATPSLSNADHQLLMETGEELITGSTRLKAGTATKIILNIISTTLMIQEGRVIDNLMVDLSPSNSKLRDRAIRIIQQLNGVNRKEAHTLLSEKKWQVRDAINSVTSKKSVGALAVVDGGGTKTRLLLLDDRGNVLLERFAGPSNPDRVSFSDIRVVLTTLFQNIECSKAIFAIAGISNYTSHWKHLLFESGCSAKEVEILHDGAFLMRLAENKPAIVVIGGTGSVVLGEAAGKKVQVGGLGAFIGDEGSGVAIGRAAVAAVFAAQAGWGKKTALTDLIYPKELKVKDPLQFAPFAKKVCELFERDSVAKEIILNQTKQLANQVTLCVTLLPKPPEKLFTSGSLFSCDNYYNSFVGNLVLPKTDLVRLEDPVLSAAILSLTPN